MNILRSVEEDSSGNVGIGTVLLAETHGGPIPFDSRNIHTIVTCIDNVTTNDFVGDSGKAGDSDPRVPRSFLLKSKGGGGDGDDDEQDEKGARKKNNNNDGSDDDEMIGGDSEIFKPQQIIRNWNDAERLESDRRQNESSATFFRMLVDDDEEGGFGDRASAGAVRGAAGGSVLAGKIVNNHEYDAASDVSQGGTRHHEQKGLKASSVPTFRILMDDSDDEIGGGGSKEDDDYFIGGGDSSESKSELDNSAGSISEEGGRADFSKSMSMVPDKKMAKAVVTPASDDGFTSLVKAKPVKGIISMASNNFGSSDPSLYKDKVPKELKEMGSKHPLRVLVVEDNVIVQKTMVKQLHLVSVECRGGGTKNDVLIIRDLTLLYFIVGIQ